MADTIYIYSDGACSGNPGPGGWAAVIIYPEGRVRELGGGERPSTNNRMEMSGAIAALVAVADRPEPAPAFLATVADEVTREAVRQVAAQFGWPAAC